MDNTKTAIALGFFDGGHIGHQAVLNAVLNERERGYTPCVFTFKMNSFAPMSKKGIVILQTQEQKEITLKRMGIEKIFSPAFEEFMDMEPREFVENVLIKEYGARFIACGYDFHFGKNAKGTVDDLRAICSEYNVELKVVEAVLYDDEAISSTRIRNAIADGNIPLANALLGRPFSLTSTIIHGKKLGRTISFPTINQRFETDSIVPKFGVYATILNLAQGRKIGATNVGIKPTVSDIPEVLAETYIVDFSGDIYGEEVEVEFYEFIRGEQKFSSIEELKNAIAQNAIDAQEICSKYQ